MSVIVGVVVVLVLDLVTHSVVGAVVLVINQ